MTIVDPEAVRLFITDLQEAAVMALTDLQLLEEVQVLQEAPLPEVLVVAQEVQELREAPAEDPHHLEVAVEVDKI